MSLPDFIHNELSRQLFCICWLNGEVSKNTEEGGGDRMPKDLAEFINKHVECCPNAMHMKNRLLLC